MRIIAISFIISFHIYGVFSLRDNQVPVYYSKNSNSSADLYEIRKGKFLPFYTVVRFKNNECTATNGLVGTCYLRSECRTKQGVAFGSCSRGLGVCCVVTRNCGGLPTSSNNTYFRSPGYPDYYNGSSTTCTISIAKNRDSATHVRLTFTDFTLAQPHPTTGQCQIDRMNVLGSEISPPVICGENTGQHMYLRFTPDNSAMQIIILANSSTTFRRRWSILVTQHEQNESPPPGCLMYFTENSGQVKSFNYNLNPPLDSTRKLANQAYSACVRTNAGYCAIEWSVSGSDPFHMSGNACKNFDQYSQKYF
ncbi:Hypothetical predicted protein [Cloeon dipterum]|uniref:CUB domain-containing protein n=1 Tax=Cloeon dipterum TaxID=197152 RepID=A0A8S1DRX9_9INSE|nr:Hypothetical predicted protein [Cloeon dipterum]